MCGNRHYGPHPVRHPQNVQVSPSVSAHHSEIWAISPDVPERMTYAVQTWTSSHPQFVKRRGKIWDAHKIHLAAKKPSKSHSKSHFNCGFLTPGTPKRNESPVVIAIAAKLNGSPALLSPNGPGEAQDTVADEPRVLSWYPSWRWALALVNNVTKNWWKDPPCYEKKEIHELNHHIFNSKRLNYQRVELESFQMCVFQRWWKTQSDHQQGCLSDHISTGIYPLVNKQFAIENGPLEIVDLPIFIAWWFSIVFWDCLPGRIVPYFPNEAVHRTPACCLTAKWLASCDKSSAWDSGAQWSWSTW